jgi:hypothetical protein
MYPKSTYSEVTVVDRETPLQEIGGLALMCDASESQDCCQDRMDDPVG